MARGKPFRANYRRCMRCENKSGCRAMCVDVCVDEIKRLEARKQLAKEIDANQYEISRSIYIQTKGDWAKLQKKKRGY